MTSRSSGTVVLVTSNIPFKDYATLHVVSPQTGELHVPIKATLRMEQTMSPSRSLTTDPDSRLIRQRLIEIGNATTVEEVLDELEQNQQRSTPIRMAAFADLRERNQFFSIRCHEARRGYPHHVTCAKRP